MSKKNIINIREGNIEEVVSLTKQFPEFELPYQVEVYQQRLQKIPFLILIAEVNGRLAGCKVGYERDQDGSFYSWIGGVLPEFRRMGIARLLAEKQEAWAKSKDYANIRFKTRNIHTNMLIFALKRGFYIIRFEPHPNLAQSRIWLEKSL